MRVEKFIVWYQDGKKLEGSTQEDWNEMPQFGLLQVLVLFTDGTSREARGNDFYFANDFGQGLVVGSTHDHMTLLQRFPWMKFGWWTTEGHLSDVHKELKDASSAWYAENHPEIPPKDCGCGD